MIQVNQEERRSGKVFGVHVTVCIRNILEDSLAGEEIKEIIIKILITLDKGIPKFSLGGS